MDADAIVRAAEKLLGAYDTRTPIDPLIDDYPDAGITDAYRIQQEQVRRWVKAGDAIKGHKVGLASPAMQRQMGVHQPDYGHLLSGMFHLEHLPQRRATRHGSGRCRTRLADQRAGLAGEHRRAARHHTGGRSRGAAGVDDPRGAGPVRRHRRVRHGRAGQRDRHTRAGGSLTPRWGNFATITTRSTYA